MILNALVKEDYAHNLLNECCKSKIRCISLKCHVFPRILHLNFLSGILVFTRFLVTYFWVVSSTCQNMWQENWKGTFDAFFFISPEIHLFHLTFLLFTFYLLATSKNWSIIIYNFSNYFPSFCKMLYVNHIHYKAMILLTLNHKKKIKNIRIYL